MFQEGDKVIIKPKFKYHDWYSNETYTILSFDEKRCMITLNKSLNGCGNLLFTDSIMFDETYYRKEKLLKIKNKIKQHGI